MKDKNLGQQRSQILAGLEAWDRIPIWAAETRSLIKALVATNCLLFTFQYALVKISIQSLISRR